MRIEINNGGLGGSGVSAFQSDFSGLISKKENVISSFKAVRTQVKQVSGGVGNLQSTVNALDRRIRQEEDSKQDAKKIQTKADDFFDLAVRVDKQVATTINKNKNEFFKKFPHLKPADPPEEKAWYEEAWDWLCGKGEEFVESIKAGWDWIKDTVKKGWDSLVAFYQEHKKIIDTILIVVGAIVAIVGVVLAGPYALAAILAAVGFSATTAATISAVVFTVALVSTGLAALANIADVWLEIDNPVFNALQIGLNVISAITTFAIDIGGIYNKFMGINPKHGIAIKEMAKTNPEKAIEMAVQDGKTNQWYLRNLVDDMDEVTFRVDDDILKGFKFKGDDTVVYWHSTDYGAPVAPPGQYGGGSGWSAHLQYRHKTIRIDGSWFRNNRVPEAHIPVIDIPKWWPK